MSEHVVPVKVYINVFLALMALLVLTVAVAYIDFGLFADVVAMTVASAKALLIILYFMHVRYSSKLVVLFAASGFFWLLILVLLTLSDFLTRVDVEGW